MNLKSRSISLFLVVILLNSIFGVYAEEDTATFVDPGLTPDSPFYGFELWREHYSIDSADTLEEKLELENQYLLERYSEMYNMILEGDEDALVAAEEAERIYNSMGTHIVELRDESTIDIASIESGDSSLHELVSIEKELTESNVLFEEIKDALNEQVAIGEISQESAEDITLNVEEGSLNIESFVADEKEVILNELISTGISPTEAEVVIYDVEENLGLSEHYREEVTLENIEELRDEIAGIQEEAGILEDQGNIEDSQNIKTLIANAEFNLEKCEYWTDHELYFGGSYDKFNHAEYYLLNARLVINGEEVDLPELTRGVELINNQIVEERRGSYDIIRFYEDGDYKKEFLQKYPDQEIYFKEEYERAKRTNELTGKLDEETIINGWFDELKAEGLTEEQIVAEISDRYTQEFQYTYGEDYVPAGIVNSIENEQGIVQEDIEVIPIGRIESIETIDPETGEEKTEIVGWIDGEGWIRENEELKFNLEGGGFVHNYEYEDPVTGINYQFAEDGYTYITPAGLTYEVEYPEGFKAENNYETGDEVYTYSYKDDDGNIVDYSYSATGFEADIKEEETSEIVEEVKESYVPGTYTVEDGGTILVTETGYSHIDENGVRMDWDFTEYGSYINPVTGKVYVPEVSHHEDNFQYDAATGEYKYISPTGEQWSYKGDGTWINPDGETVQKGYVPAPVGYEGEREYITPQGEKWVYSEGAWEKYNSGEGTVQDRYVPPPNHYYSEYKGEYRDYQGNVHSTNSFTAPDGKTWSRDDSTGEWKSSSGETYNPESGITTGSSGEYNYGHYYSGGQDTSTYKYDTGAYWVANPDGSYSYHDSAGSSSGTTSGTYTDQSGNTWSQGADGGWSCSGSCGGDSGSYSSGGYSGGSGSSYPGSSSSGGGTYGGGYDSSGNYVGGSYGGYDSSGSYVGTGGGDSGSYSGGSSTPSGGDSSAPTGGVITRFPYEEEYGLDNAVAYIFKEIF